MINAKPCVVCGEKLEDADVLADNQPYGGTTFISHGQYGSTAYDPMDGRYIELNLCDPCLRTAADKGWVLERRARKPVVCKGITIGWLKTPQREYVQWDGRGSGDPEDVLNVEPEEVGATWLPEIDWEDGIVERYRERLDPKHDTAAWDD